MAAFKAINVDYEDESDVEVDDTKELQIEDALKSYQNALKFHSDGQFADAEKAYETLFQSEIFSYPESHNLFRRIELYGPLAEPEELLLEEQDEVVIQGPVGSTDNAPSTLPQILHLAHKNYAAFVLKTFLTRLSHPDEGASNLVSFDDINAAARKALGHYVDALDKDESDLELWTDLAYLTRANGSQRTGRFCFEAILQDGDDDPLLDLVKLPALAQSLAGQSLCRLVADVPDALSLSQKPLSDIKRKRLARMLRGKQLADPFDLLRTVRSKLVSTAHDHFDAPAPQHIVINPSTTWCELANLINNSLSDQQNKSSEEVSHSCVIEVVSTEPFDPAPAIPSDTPARSEKSSIVPFNPAWADYQFPGLDGGSVTACNPQHDLDLLALAKSSDGATAGPAFATRKRSSNAVDLLETAENGRTKSKRIRARESLLDTSTMGNSNALAKIHAQVEQDLAFLRDTDAAVFDDTLDIFLSEIKVEPFNFGESFKEEISTEIAMPRSNHDNHLPSYDMFQLMCNFDRKIAKCSQVKPDAVFEDSPSQDILDRSLLSAKVGPHASHKWPVLPSEPLPSLIQDIDMQDCTTLRLTSGLLRHFLVVRRNHDKSSNYMAFRWPEGLATAICQILMQVEPILYQTATKILHTASDESMDNDFIVTESLGLYSDFNELAQFAVTVFEIFFDHSLRDQGPNQPDNRVHLARWADLCQDLMRIYLIAEGNPSSLDALTLRFIWTSTFYLATAPQSEREYVIACLQELRHVFSDTNLAPLELPNNPTLQVMSIQVIDQEISKLRTAEFFRLVFDTEHTDSVEIIERLEPLLEEIHHDVLAQLGSGKENQHSSVEHPHSQDKSDEPRDDELHKSAEDIEILHILRKGDLPLRLSLWRRLRDAYEHIKFSAMASNCTLRIAETLVAELSSPTYVESNIAKRQTFLMKTIGQLEVLLKSFLVTLKDREDGLDAFDISRLRSALTSLVRILRITHAFDLFKDESDLELRSEPSGSDSKTFSDLVYTLHDLELHAFTLLLILYKDVMSQMPHVFATPQASWMELIRTVHRVVGMRGFCHAAGRAFLHYIKAQLAELAHVDGYQFEFSQILYDMHGLRCFANPSDQLDHQSTLSSALDRTTAQQALSLVLVNVADIKAADLYKHPIKDAIDKIHSVVSRKKPTEAIQINRIKLSAFFRSTIKPLDLYRCLSGHTHLNMAAALGPQHDLAVKGWYMLLGNSFMSKFNAQKKAPSGPTGSDLDWAITYIRHDIEAIGISHWETWYRLAQAMDAKIENVLLYSAEKINGVGNTDIVGYERTALHCYMMATALTSRLEDIDFESLTKIATLYGDFACRLYSSTRAPFDMQAFALQNEIRFISVGTIYKAQPFEELTECNAWRVAKQLFRQAIAGNQDNWLLYYMQGKVLWKLHSAKRSTSDYTYVDYQRPSCQQVLAVLTRSIDTLPRERKDSKKDLILEPHYKIVSIVDKLYLRGELEFDEAQHILNETTPYARKVSTDDKTDWKDYILAVIKNVQHADKSHWHHRLMIRAAKIVYTNDRVGAQMAKEELMQHMFTKTMTLQVWKPEHERPGRHFVYTAQYTLFFVNLLKQLGDMPNMEQLAKRTRKRAADYLDFSAVWTELAHAYMWLLRRHADVALGEELLVFQTLDYEQFLAIKGPLEAWCQDASNECKALSVLRDAIEFKKLNGNLMKPMLIDDLIADAYAVLFCSKGRELWKDIQKAEAESRRVQQLAEIKSSMSLTSLMNVDGARSPPRAGPDAAGFESDKVDEVDALPSWRQRLGVGRREIRISAENCQSKSVQTSGKPEREPPAESSRPSRLRDVLPRRPSSRQSSASSTRSDDGDGDGDAHQLPIDTDDSELSEVDAELIDEGRRIIEEKVLGEASTSRPRSSAFGLDGTAEFDDPFEDERKEPAEAWVTDVVMLDNNFDDADDEADVDGSSTVANEEEVFLLVDEDDGESESVEPGRAAEVSSVTSSPRETS